MMQLLEIFAPAICVVAAMCAAFFLGKRHERTLWNNLIVEGKLPKPGYSRFDTQYNRAL